MSLEVCLLVREQTEDVWRSWRRSSPTSLQRTTFPSLRASLPLLNIPLPNMDLSKYIECLSQWPDHLPQGLPTVGALLLLVTGGLVVASKLWTFLRVILSLFVLPGKPVCYFTLQLWKWKLTLVIYYSFAPLVPQAAGQS